MLDDVGFAQLGCYGSDIATPNIDRLAAGGLRFSNFHTTALCSPTRVVPAHRPQPPPQRHGPGRRPRHRASPATDGRIPRENGFLSEILARPRLRDLRRRQVAPHARRRDAHGGARATLAARPRLRALVRLPRRRDAPVRADARPRQPLRTDRRAPSEDGYHLTEDLADHAIEYLGDLRAVDADKPFFLYFATGACHSPHHAPPEWIERYRGHFDAGLGRVARRDVRPPAGERACCPRARELSPRPDVGAGVGRRSRRRPARRRALHGVLRRVPVAHRRADRPRRSTSSTRLGELDNTLVIVVSDNGASVRRRRERARSTTRGCGTAPPPVAGKCAARIDELGGPRLHNNYPWGWTMAGNTPFRRWKREVHEGGIADPCIVRWPRRHRDARRRGAPPVRARDRRVADRCSTLVGVEAPAEIGGVAQSPIDGTSFAYRPRRRRRAPERHTTQYFEMLGSPRHLPRRLEGGDVQADRRMYDDGLDPDAPSTTTCGSCST